MGTNLVRRLIRAGHEVVVYDMNPETVTALAAEGAVPSNSVADLVAKLHAPRVVWLMVPAGATGAVVDQVGDVLGPEDIVFDVATPTIVTTCGGPRSSRSEASTLLTSERVEVSSAPLASGG